MENYKRKGMTPDLSRHIARVIGTIKYMLLTDKSRYKQFWADIHGENVSDFDSLPRRARKIIREAQDIQREAAYEGVDTFDVIIARQMSASAAPLRGERARHGRSG